MLPGGHATCLGFPDDAQDCQPHPSRAAGLACHHHTLHSWDGLCARMPANKRKKLAHQRLSADMQALQEAVQQMQSKRLLPASVGHAIRQLLQQQHGKVQVRSQRAPYWLTCGCTSQALMPDMPGQCRQLSNELHIGWQLISLPVCEQASRRTALDHARDQHAGAAELQSADRQGAAAALPSSGSGSGDDSDEEASSSGDEELSADQPAGTAHAGAGAAFACSCLLPGGMHAQLPSSIPSRRCLLPPFVTVRDRDMALKTMPS